MGNMLGGGGGGGNQPWVNRPPDPAPPPPISDTPPPPVPVLPDWLLNKSPYDIPVPAAPAPAPAPVVMPVPDPLAQRKQEIRKMADARARQTTRASTIIGDDTLGSG